MNGICGIHEGGGRDGADGARPATRRGEGLGGRSALAGPPGRRRRPWVKKGRYHEMLTDMNTRQIARLDAAQLAALNRVFREHEDLLAWFGYRIMDAAA